jgi:hypothetical protein
MKKNKREKIIHSILAIFEIEKVHYADAVQILELAKLNIFYAGMRKINK